MRVVVWSPGIPHRTEGASTVIFWHYLRGFRDSGHDILNVLLLDPSTHDEARLAAYRADMEGDRFEIMPVFTDRQLVQARLGSITLRRDLVAAARSAVAEWAPDAAVAIDFLAAWCATPSPAPLLVWLGDLNFQTHWYHARYTAQEHPRAAMHLPLAAIRARAWRRIYRDVLTQAGDIVVSSASSIDAMRRLGLSSEYEPFPWLVEPRPVRTSPPPAKPTFLFFGTHAGLGSRSAFHLLEAMRPDLDGTWGPEGYRIAVAGRGPLPPWASAWQGSWPAIDHVGFVDDVDRALDDAHAVLAPIDVPVGNRSRVVMAMGKRALVIGHRNLALANTDLVDGRTCYLGNGAREIVDRMRRAVDDPERSAEIARTAEEVYRARFAPDVAVPRFVRRVAAFR